MCAMLAAVVSVIVVALYFKVEKKQEKKKANHVSRFRSWNLSTSQGSFESVFFYLFIYANE